jgi:hypothetical protein
MRAIRALCSLAACAALTAPRFAAAQQGDVSAAAATFSRAQEAEARGEHARAAGLYELANRISPAPASLRSATRARMTAGQLGSAAVNAEELKRRYPDDSASMTLADEVLREAKAKLARVEASCTPGCHLVVDGLAASSELNTAHVVYVDPGAHSVVARFDDGSSATEKVQGAAGQELRVALAQPAGGAAAPPLSGTQAPAPAPLPPPSTESTPPPADTGRSDGWSPAVGLTIGGIALAVGGVAIWSALDTQNDADDFEKNPTRDAFEDGEGKDVRTNVLIGVAGVLGVTSITVLAFATDWGGGDQARLGLGLTASGGRPGFRLHGSF